MHLTNAQFHELLHLVEQHEGPVVDQIVSEYVMGIVPCTEWWVRTSGMVKMCDHKDGRCYSTKRLRVGATYMEGGPKPYSSSIIAAWEMWQHFLQQAAGQWHWTFTGGGGTVSLGRTGWNEEEDLHGAMPHAVCAFVLGHHQITPDRFRELVQEQIRFVL